MIQGIGNGHDPDMHHVTQCMHDHAGEKKQRSGAAAQAVSAQNNAVRQALEPQGELSLAAWLRNAFSTGKKLLLQGLHSGPSSSGTEGVRGATDPRTEAMPETRFGPDSGGKNGEEAALLNAGTIAASNPYFSAAPKGEHKTSAEKGKIRFHAITKYLNRRFSGKNSFRTRQERPRQDLRRHSRYREKDFEMECILTDDSYLLDSYDKRGEYTKLSAKK